MLAIEPVEQSQYKAASFALDLSSATDNMQDPLA